MLEISGLFNEFDLTRTAQYTHSGFGYITKSHRVHSVFTGSQTGHHNTHGCPVVQQSSTHQPNFRSKRHVLCIHNSSKIFGRSCCNSYIRDAKSEKILETTVELWMHVYLYTLYIPYTFGGNYTWCGVATADLSAFTYSMKVIIEKLPQLFLNMLVSAIFASYYTNSYSVIATIEPSKFYRLGMVNKIRRIKNFNIINLNVEQRKFIKDLNKRSDGDVDLNRIYFLFYGLKSGGSLFWIAKKT